MTKEEVRRQFEGSGAWHLLNSIQSGEHTQKLLKIIPEETVKTILRVYRELRRLCEITAYDKLIKKNQFPTRTVKNIQKELETIKTVLTPKGDKMMVKRGFLDAKDIEDIMNLVKERIKQGPKGLDTLSAMGKAAIRKKEKVTRPPDIALNMLIFFLAEHLKAKTAKRRWGLIHEFLKEQGIDLTNKEPELKDKFRDIQKRKLQTQYQDYRDLWLYPERNLKAGISQHRLHSSDITLPYWSELFP